MSERTTANLTLERVNRLALAMADLTESQSARGRQLVAMNGPRKGLMLTYDQAASKDGRRGRLAVRRHRP
jgi:hypothetical protein